MKRRAKERGESSTRSTKNIGVTKEIFINRNNRHCRAYHEEWEAKNFFTTSQGSRDLTIAQLKSKVWSLCWWSHFLLSLVDWEYVTRRKPARVHISLDHWWFEYFFSKLWRRLSDSRPFLFVTQIQAKQHSWNENDSDDLQKSHRPSVWNSTEWKI